MNVKASVIDVEECKQYKANTIDKYNRDIDGVGYDTVFGRKVQFALERPLLKTDTPPFHAIKCVASMTSMERGPKINARSQVINQCDQVIPGLYTAREVTGGLRTKMYLLGVMSPGSITFGIIAGSNAAKEPAWQ